ncbi:MAG: hypothetical protein JRG67_12310 [Deltaproteobacteria bacterium]|nr:hypothetical protein [Deltaproteobacteria bacterium]MBW1876468.1 hypothetical protein [Deltaproteobacteria bacterium]MBW2211805.1 hypothetical protein [Deltaproteobacteria bacterium]MBW2380890.1 hypothetical protein [Deltaproteobacteria bacterium]MBW2588539.1 hypothetical protein [Deltaproteobacteria bacterium]
MNNEVRKYLATIGQRGGQKSRRLLDAETARDMVRVREARRAYRRFHATCFWSFDPEYVVTLDDVPWVTAELRKHGGRAAWEAANRLCR